MSTNNTKQTAWIALGSFFSFIVGIVSPMVLSRFFTIGDYGTYKQVMYVYNTLLVVFTLGLPKAYSYFLPKYPEDQSKAIIGRITSLFWVLGALFSVLLFCGSGCIAKLMNNPELSVALRLFAPVPLLLLPTMGVESVCASFKRAKLLAIYTVITRLLTILLIVIPVAFFKGTYIHAIIGFDIASFVTCLLALFIMYFPSRTIASRNTTVSYRDILKFALPLFLASIWGGIISSANQFFVSRYYGNEEFAVFSNGFMEMPVASMVVSAIATVLLPVFSGQDTGAGMTSDALSLWKAALIKSAKVIFPILIFSIFFADLIIRCMYGEQYSGSAIFFIIKNISSLLYIIPFAPIILAIGKTKEYANIHMIIAFLVIMFEYFACKIFCSSISIAIISELCQFLKIYLMIRIISKYAEKNIRKLIPIKQLSLILVGSCISSIIAKLIVHYVNINKFILLLFGGLIFIFIYYSLCWILKISYKEMVFSIIGNDNKHHVLKFIP